MAHDHEEPKEMEWNAQSGLMKRLTSEGAEKFFSQENLPEVESSFVDHKDQVCCMDEGTACISGENKLAMAGSGILFPAASWRGRLNRVADLYIQSGVTKITSHDGCGAAGIAWKRDSGKEGTGFDNSDDYGKTWVKELERIVSQKLQAVGEKTKVNIVHIDGKDVARPREFHNARVVWFDAIGKFNPHLLGDKLPKGFLIDYYISNGNGVTDEERDYPFAELQVAIDIALGGHGFGSKFTKEDPFTIVVIARDKAELEKIKKKTEKLVGQHDGRVKVDGFVKE